MFKISRRQFLLASALTTAGWLSSPSGSGWGRARIKQPLSFFHTHTGETLEILPAPGGLTPSAQRKINTFLRDFRTGGIHPIDPGLLHILSSIQQVSGSTGTIEVISGYRSKQTNLALAQKSHGVAKKSLHMQGQAIDIRITDLPTRKLRDTARTLGLGGVGYYAQSDFVHLDTGRFRTW